MYNNDFKIDLTVCSPLIKLQAMLVDKAHPVPWNTFLLLSFVNIFFNLLFLYK